MPTRLSNAEISTETDALMRIVRYNIRRYMRLQDINQKEIAELLNLTRPAISQMLAGISRPRFDQVFMIAQYLGVNMNDLMDETAYHQDEELRERMLANTKGAPADTRPRLLVGAPSGIRTLDTLIKSQML